MATGRCDTKSSSLGCWGPHGSSARRTATTRTARKMQRWMFHRWFACSLCRGSRPRLLRASRKTGMGLGPRHLLPLSAHAATAAPVRSDALERKNWREQWLPSKELLATELLDDCKAKTNKVSSRSHSGGSNSRSSPHSQGSREHQQPQQVALALQQQGASGAVHLQPPQRQQQQARQHQQVALAHQ